MSLNRKEAINLIDKIRAFGITDQELIDSIFTNILPSHMANSLAIDLADEYDIPTENDDEDIFEEDDEYEGEHVPFGY